MALQRYMLVRGKPGVAVTNPWAFGSNPRRYAGKRMDEAMMAEPEHMDRLRDVAEVLVSHLDLIKACNDGDLELLDKCEAFNFDDAAYLLKGDS